MTTESRQTTRNGRTRAAKHKDAPVEPVKPSEAPEASEEQAEEEVILPDLPVSGKRHAPHSQEGI